MPGALITDLRHFLDERGRIAPTRGPAKRLADFLTNIVATITHDLDEPTAPIRCRRRPQRKPCPGQLDVIFTVDDEIIWRCPCCDDQGAIAHWQDTFWDLMNAPTPPEPSDRS